MRLFTIITLGLLSFFPLSFILEAVSTSEKETFTPTPLFIDYSSFGLDEPLIPADNKLSVEGVELGRYLFYDSILSLNYKTSCGSCHVQRYSFTDGKRRAIGTFGDTLEFNTMPLINLAWESSFFWNGRSGSLEKAVLDPIFHKKEMAINESIMIQRLSKNSFYKDLFQKAFPNSTLTKELVAKALSQFIRTIIVRFPHLPDSLLNIPMNGETEQEFVQQRFYDQNLRGVYFRFSEMRGSCHTSNVYSGYGLNFNNYNKKSNLMKVPSLINVRFTGPYMHNGGLLSLNAIAEHYKKNISFVVNNIRKGGDTSQINYISDYDKKMLPIFLRFLEDTSIIYDKKFSNPFFKKH